MEKLNLLKQIRVSRRRTYYSKQWHGMANEHNSFTAFQCLTYENLSH